MDAILPVIYLALALYLGRTFLDDYKAQQKGMPNEGSLPGAFPAPKICYIIGIVGALLLVLIETGGEYALGIAEEGSKVAAISLLSWVAAGFIEEIFFRGFLVIRKHGKKTLIASIVGFSLVFALIHGHLYDSEKYVMDISPEGLWWTLILFVNSLFFYYIRFMPQNKERSLLPCFVAHIASNLGVFAVKLAQGYVTSWI